MRARVGAADSPFPDENKAAMSRRILFTFRLHVAGQAQHSIQAITNLAALCRIHLSHHCEAEVVNLFHETQRAPGGNVFLMPTLIKRLPMLVKCAFNTLNHNRTALLTLKLGSSAQ